MIGAMADTGLSRESPELNKKPRQPAGELQLDPAHSLPAAGKPKRKSKGTSPTTRTLKYMRANGYLAEVVEKRLPRVFITKDLFGFIDVLAVKGEDIIGIQTTSGSNVAARMTKIVEHENYPTVIAAMRIVVHGWRKNAAGKWVLREVEL